MGNPNIPKYTAEIEKITVKPGANLFEIDNSGDNPNLISKINDIITGTQEEIVAQLTNLGLYEEPDFEGTYYEGDEVQTDADENEIHTRAFVSELATEAIAA